MSSFLPTFLSSFLWTFLVAFLSTFLSSFFVDFFVAFSRFSFVGFYVEFCVDLFVELVVDFFVNFYVTFFSRFNADNFWSTQPFSATLQSKMVVLVVSILLTLKLKIGEGVRLPNYILTLQVNPGGRNDMVESNFRLGLFFFCILLFLFTVLEGTSKEATNRLGLATRMVNTDRIELTL